MRTRIRDNINMIKWYLSVKKLLRDIEQKTRDALALYEEGGKNATKTINGYIKSDYKSLEELWRVMEPKGTLGNLGRHIHFGMDQDYNDIINNDLPLIEKKADIWLTESEEGQEKGELGFEHLLHPVILKNSYQLFRNGHLREAVLNSVVAVFDYIRDVTGVNEDGDRLIGQVFSLDDPYLVLSNIRSESGRNDQKGFMQIYKGMFQGIRNPKAHSLTHDLTELKAAQYLVFSSLLARRIEEAKILKKI